jgi:hypothetical protein
MNEERTGKCLGQVEHIRGHFGTQIFHNGQPGYGGDSKTVPMLSIGKCKKMYIDS